MENYKKFIKMKNKKFRNDYFFEYIKDELFEKCFNYIIDMNKNPYHNNKHILFVFSFSIFLFDLYKKELNLSNKDRHLLGVAALFHDYNHSGGKLTDEENIELAIKGLKKFIKDNSIDINEDEIINIIKCTEFPHKDIKLSELQKIIRDADTVGGIMDDWFNTICSLADEMKKSLYEWIPFQIKFLDNLKFNTLYCNELLKTNKDIIIKELLHLKTLER
jgi:HD superfamily phosphohydrolase YqeK